MKNEKQSKEKNIDIKNENKILKNKATKKI